MGIVGNTEDSKHELVKYDMSVAPSLKELKKQLPKSTLRQLKFFRHYTVYHNGAEATKYAGYKCKDRDSYYAMGSYILRSIKTSFPELLNACGLGTDRLAEKLNEQLEATKPIYATFQGKIGDVQMYPDNAARGKAVELLGRAHGVYIDKHELTGKGGGDLTFEFVPPGQGKGSKEVLLLED